MLEYLFTACIIGLLVAVPVGPISILCMKYTLEHGLVGAALVGTGIALADMIYASVAALGLYSISDFLVRNVSFIKVFGGAFLLYLGYKELKARSIRKLSTLNGSMFKLVWRSMLLTLTNPLTTLTFVGVFASVDLVAQTMLQVLSVILGVFLGSFIWWIIVGLVITHVRAKFSDKVIDRVRNVSVFMFMTFGLFAAVSGLLGVLKLVMAAGE